MIAEAALLIVVDKTQAECQEKRRNSSKFRCDCRGISMISGNPEQAAENRSWSDFEQWNVLFETLCGLRGFATANDLAQVYCRRTRRQTQRDLDTAARSINNWRSGSHAPSARNLAILAQLLDVASDPALDEAWHALYRKAKDQTELASGAARTSRFDGSWMAALIQVGQGHLVSILAVLVTLAAFVSGFAFWYIATETPAAVSARSRSLIPFRRTVILSVGQSAVVHGHRGDCGGPAPDKESTTAILPSKIGIGTLTAGGIGMRYSRRCNGLTPAREVILHAKRVGSEQIELFDDVITVAVTK